MLDKGINSALKSSEVRRQTAEFEKIATEKSSDFSVVDQPSLFAPADNSSKEIACAETTAPIFEEPASMRKAGRPKGAKNKSTKEWVEYFLATIGESPLMALGRLYSQDTIALARRLQCGRLDAMKLQISAASAALPYVHQKQPVAVEINSEELPTINIYTSPTVYQQINNGNGQVKKEIIVDGIASTAIEQISSENNNLDIEQIAKSED